MTEKQIDFLKVKKMIGKCTPEQLGTLMKQYYAKLLSDLPVYSNYLEEAADLFKTPLDTQVNSGKMSL
jgi:hypothetical protein